MDGYPNLPFPDCLPLMYASPDLVIRGNSVPALTLPYNNGANLPSRPERAEHYQYQFPFSVPISTSSPRSSSVAIQDHLSLPYDTCHYRQQGTYDAGTHNGNVNHVDQEPLPQHGFNDLRSHVPRFGSFGELQLALPSPVDFPSTTNFGFSTQLAAVDQKLPFPEAFLPGGDQNKIAFKDDVGHGTVQMTSTLHRIRRPRKAKVGTRGPYFSANRNPCGKCKASHIKCTVVSTSPFLLCQYCKKKGLRACA